MVMGKTCLLNTAEQLYTELRVCDSKPKPNRIPVTERGTGLTIPPASNCELLREKAVQPLVCGSSTKLQEGFSSTTTLKSFVAVDLFKGHKAGWVRKRSVSGKS